MPAGETITVPTTPVGLTAATYAFSREAHIYVEKGPLRMYYDGREPTATEGIPMVPNSQINLRGPREMADFRIIRDTDAAADGAIIVTYRYW